MDHIRWGILGCGDVTEVKSGPAFQKAKGSALIAVMRRNGEKAKDYALRHGVPKWYDDAEQLIHDCEVDAIYVATPPSSHAKYAIQAIEAGKPVYIEKPMALNYAECEHILRASKNADIPVFVAYYRRALPLFLKVKQLIESGALGAVRVVTCELIWPPEENETLPQSLHWHVLPEISGGGRFVDVGCHQLDFLDFLFGPIMSIQGQITNQAGLYPAEDAVCASFQFTSNVLGCGMWCFTISECSRVDQLKIIGERGTLVFSSFARAPLQLITAAGIEEYDIPWPKHVEQPLIQTAVDELRGCGKCPSTGETAARTNRVMDTILHLWQTKQ